MDDRKLSRRQLLKAAGALGVAAAALDPIKAFADDEEVELLRWDLIAITQLTITQRFVLSGGQDKAKTASGDVVTLTGSGQVEPKRERATGGGTFVVKHANGTELKGVYTVTGFESFKAAGGSLAGAGPIDGIGTLKQTMGGLLLMKVELVASDGTSHPGVLGVDCALPGVEFPIEEGVTLTTGPLKFTQKSGGSTLFHVLHGEHRD
jgi:hypothetical protein